jgi:hypothetical protein
LSDDELKLSDDELVLSGDGFVWSGDEIEWSDDKLGQSEDEPECRDDKSIFARPISPAAPYGIRRMRAYTGNGSFSNFRPSAVVTVRTNRAGIAGNTQLPALE